MSSSGTRSLEKLPGTVTPGAGQDRKAIMHLVVLVTALVVLSVISLFVGVGPLTPAHLLQLTPLQMQILTISRLPRLISIVVAGSSLSICGMIMQQLTQNRFVSPTTAGTIDSARLGVLVSLIFFPAASLLQRVVVSVLFALAGTLVFMRLLDRIKYKDVIFVPLVGLMFGNLVSAAATFVAYRYDLVQSLVTWLFGDFSMILAGRYEILYLVLPLMGVAYLYARRFTIAGMGEDFATNLGLNYQQVVKVGLFIVAAVSAMVVLTVGSLPFLGLIVPNMVSLWRGDNLEKNLLPTGILGALLVLACDVAGRLILYPYEVSVGLLMGVLGSGIFLLLLVRRQAYGA